ncbi:MAG TPA: DUF2121 domain-containing protein, partial [Methanomicrobiales archaeon]|nr:DUF2121 domain-containing protein [Methanomicrobiales archaeon]
TLVMAFIGERGAVMAGDRREITFLGDRASMERLEEELYTGEIVTDGELWARAGELGVQLAIRDDKVKVRGEEGVLVGEVTSLEGGVLRRRRLYASGGSYAILDFEAGSITPRGSGGAGNFVVLGNEKTKAFAHRCIREGWRDGTMEDAEGLIARAMELASRETASVSRRYILIRTGERADVRKLVNRDTVSLP